MEDRVMIQVDKEELYNIVCDYGTVESKLNNLLIVLNALRTHYEAEMQNTMEANVSVIIEYLTMIQEDLVSMITRTDKLLLRKVDI